MSWFTLPRNLLEQQFDSLGLERHFENGIMDTAENVEKLSDYYDDKDDYVPKSRRGPRPKRCSQRARAPSRDETLEDELA